MDGVVELNVGGTLMTTLMSTLKKEPRSKLAVMFSLPEAIAKDKNGRCFIDCDSEIFAYILNFLRSGTLPRQERVLEVYDLALFFQIQSLVSQLEHNYAIQYRNQITEQYKCLRKSGEYEQQKKNIVEKILENLHCTPRGDISIYVTEASGSCIDCPIRPAHVFLQLPSNLCDRGRVEELRALLIYDLCELGFAKSIVTKKINRSCDSCGTLFKGKEIVLVAH
ncbi:BTB/POZ domain-containing protein KCTD6-like isoform X2 [Mercenaria mercenaria]|nr:BTB/POZ domain-containing protein KCTD6-like isoform X2 [Mercenaria mercenaria]